MSFYIHLSNGLPRLSIRHGAQKVVVHGPFDHVLFKEGRVCVPINDDSGNADWINLAIAIWDQSDDDGKIIWLDGQNPDCEDTYTTMEIVEGEFH